jgi:Flp pilus assembly protein TadG
MRRYNQRHRGMAVIWMAILGFVLLGFIMLALDTGRVYFIGHQLQNTADAAALAAVNALPDGNTAARAAALTTAYNNYVDGTPVVIDSNTANAATGDTVLGKYDPKTFTFTPTTTHPNACKVVARRPAVALMLGSLFGVSTSNVSRNAIAVAEPLSGPGLILLSPHDKNALYLKGAQNAQINVIGSGIQVNSDNAQAVSLQGIVVANEVNIVGSGGDVSKIKGNPPPINFNQPVMPDPLEYLPRIDPSQYTSPLYGGDRTATPDTQLILEPGYYANGLPGANNITYRLRPGIYILGGNGASANGASYVGDGGGVMLYLLTPPSGTTLPAVGPTIGTNLNIRAPSPDLGDTFYGADTYAGIGIYQEKIGAKTVLLNFIGTPNVNVDGTAYLPDTAITANGDLTQLGLQVFLWSLDLQGSTTLNPPPEGYFDGGISNRIYLIK